MRRIGLAVAVFLLAGGVRPALAATSGPLDGTWNIAHRAYTPSSSNDPVASLINSLGYNVQVANGQLTCQDANQGSYTVPITFDGSNPQNVDIGWVGSQFDLPGIYKVNGNVVTMALSFDSTRPTTYDDTVNYLVVVLTKVP